MTAEGVTMEGKAEKKIASYLAFIVTILLIVSILFKNEQTVPGRTMNIHIYTKSGDLEKVRRILDNVKHKDKIVNAYDDTGMTPLMLAVKSSDADLELVQFLLDSGAKVNLERLGGYQDGRTVLSHTISAGDPSKVALLLNNGADFTTNMMVNMMQS
jgi:hypothetical protein